MAASSDFVKIERAEEVSPECRVGTMVSNRSGGFQ